MHYFGVFKEARFSELKPNGFIKEMLERELNGVVGHFDELGYPFHLTPWAQKDPVETECARWWPYEQTAYWIDALSRASALLDDWTVFEKVRPQVEQALAQADPYIGPNIIREEMPCCRWPHAVFFRALYALWSKTGDDKIMQKMREHYRGDLNLEYGQDRTLMSLEMMLRVASYYDDEALFRKAKRSMDLYLKRYGPSLEYFHYYLKGLPKKLNRRKETGDMSSYMTGVFHGVSYNETAKMPALMYLYTGDRKYLDYSLEALRVMENCHMMPDGVNSSCEHLHGNDGLALHESCDITDFTYFMGILLEATGEAKYADKIERAMLNAYFGVTDKDYHAFQYFSSLNQVVSTSTSSYVANFADEKLAFQPLHNPQCCAGNLGRAFPNYVYRMYQETEKGVAVSLFGDCDYNGKNMEIVQTGDYPFNDSVTLKIVRADARKNELRVRIPAWSVSTALTLNGKKVRYEMVNGYAVLKVHSGDEIVMTTVKRFECHNSSDRGMYFTYGPFLLSLKIDANKVIDTKAVRSNSDFPAYNMTPASDWNFAVCEEEQPTFVKPVSSENRVFEIQIRARVLNDWKLQTMKDPKGVDVTFTPAIPGEDFINSHLGEFRDVTLVPYGSTELRLTIFPRYSNRGTYIFSPERIED